MIKNSHTVPGFKPAHGLWRKEWQPATRDRPTIWLGHSLAARSSRGDGPRRGSGARAPDAFATWSPHGGHARGGEAARLVRVLRRTRCPEKGGMSTVRAAATRLTRWQRRGLSRATARRAGEERRRSDHGWRRW
jgi:hypothetical protein